jgi:hypothetical protein
LRIVDRSTERTREPLTRENERLKKELDASTGVSPAVTLAPQ